MRAQSEELRRHIRRVRTVDDVEESHRARINGKRLRYLLEPIAPHVTGGPELLTRLRSLQDSLGDLHDAHVWLSVLRHVVADIALEEGRQMANALTDLEHRRKKRKGPPRAGLVSLGRLAHERAGVAFERFRTEWVEGCSKDFHRDISDLADHLDARAPSAMEIERKYLLKGLPETMPGVESLVIRQGYLPGERLVERLRAVKAGEQETYYRTVKVGSGLVRTELEEETSDAVFRKMWPLTTGKRLTKRRHRVPNGELTWEIDEFTDRRLVLAEVELPEAGTEVEIPGWLQPYVDREVTGEVEFLNSTLAK
jgi:CYTH domain-containing protein